MPWAGGWWPSTSWSAATASCSSPRSITPWSSATASTRPASTSPAGWPSTCSRWPSATPQWKPHRDHHCREHHRGRGPPARDARPPQPHRARMGPGARAPRPPAEGRRPPRREAGRIFGRGSVDAKGPLAAAIAAVALQPRSGLARFTVIGCVDEEGDSRGARQVATRPSPAALIVLEPSGWEAVTVGYRGIVRAELRLEDALRHRAAPESTVADRLVGLLAHLQAQLEDRGAGRSPFHRADLRVTGLEVMDTGLRETAVARLQFRLPPDLGSTSLLDWLDGERGEAELLVQFAIDAVHTPRDSRVARALTR